MFVSNTPSCTTGMTLRDQFAIAAMTGMYVSGNTPDCTVSEVAHDAYRMADAMMAARGEDMVAAERERCAMVAESLMELLSVSIDPYTSAACAARFASDAVIKIRSGK